MNREMKIDNWITLQNNLELSRKKDYDKRLDYLILSTLQKITEFYQEIYSDMEIQDKLLNLINYPTLSNYIIIIEDIILYLKELENE